MQRILNIETLGKVGEKVLLKGWVQVVRKHGNISFFELRDRSALLQVVASKQDIPDLDLHPEDVVEVEGTIQARPEKMANKHSKTGTVELSAKKIKVLESAEILPFDTGAPELNVELPVLLDYRSLSLRHPKVQAIFKLQDVVLQTFRQILREHDFTEVSVPTIVPTATEGGAEVFPIQYFDKTAYLAQSPQFFKQIMVAVFERVFTVSHAYRAEPSVTTRHMTEYVGLDAEMGFIESWLDVLNMADTLVKSIFKAVGKECGDILKSYNTTVPETTDITPRLKLAEALQIIYQRTGRDNRKEPDLSPEDEREICKWAHEEKGSEILFISHYPTKKRPMYTMPDPDDSDYTLSFDMIGRGVEWITGGQRINDYKTLVGNIKKWGNDPKDFANPYLQAFKYGMPPEGGFCLGLERISQNILGLSNIREASLFPRDMTRIDFRLAEKNKKSKNSHGEEIFERICQILDKNGCKYKKYEHKAVFTSQQAADARGTSLEQGVKALIMLADKKPVMLVLSATDKVDSTKFKQIFVFSDLRMASAEEVERVSGLKIGAIPPFAKLFKIPCYLDKGLGLNKEIVFNAGLNTKSIKMKYKDYEKIVKPKVSLFAQKA